MIRCKRCGQQTDNPKFCSRNCSAIYNNKRRKHKEKFCKHCGKSIGYKTRRITCYKCNPNYVNWNRVSLEEIKKLKSYPRSRIRLLARAVYFNSEKPKYCMNCGYDKTFHVCHIKAISDFDLEVSISKINSIDNLVALCPNCHWEFDNNLIEERSLYENI